MQSLLPAAALPSPFRLIISVVVVEDNDRDLPPPLVIFRGWRRPGDGPQAPAPPPAAAAGGRPRRRRGVPKGVHLHHHDAGEGAAAARPPRNAPHAAHRRRACKRKDAGEEGVVTLLAVGVGVEGAGAGEKSRQKGCALGCPSVRLEKRKRQRGVVWEK